MNGLSRTQHILYLFLLGILFLPAELWAQDEDKSTSFPLDSFYVEIKNRPRKLFKNIRFSFSTGYGNTYFSHELDGFGIYQAPGQQPSIFIDPSPTIRIANWVTKSAPDNSTYDPTAFQVSPGGEKLGFKGNALNIPFKGTIHYEWKRYRLGGGYSFELMNIGTMHPISLSDNISDYQPSGSSGWMSKYFGMFGVSFYRLGEYVFTGDLQIGGFNPGANFDASQVQAGVYYNLGVSVERDLSEYLRVFARPSFEIKSYSLTLPEGGPAIDHNINAFYINIGISYSIPELRKCFNKNCKIQMNHAHGDREYRSRVHPIYKKQNPQYGENYPKLIKYKGKNKKKLNPY